MTSWEEKAREDLSRAELARIQGNEGRVRVCARRAAGWAAKAYLKSIDSVNIKKSGFQNISQLLDKGLLNAEDLYLIEHLTTSLEKDDPDGEFYWPEDIDLLDDSRKLILRLFPKFVE